MSFETFGLLNRKLFQSSLYPLAYYDLFHSDFVKEDLIAAIDTAATTRTIVVRASAPVCLAGAPLLLSCCCSFISRPTNCLRNGILFRHACCSIGQKKKATAIAVFEIVLLGAKFFKSSFILVDFLSWFFSVMLLVFGCSRQLLIKAH